MKREETQMRSLTILSVPRSGSTWLGQIFNSSPETIYRFQPNFAYSFPHKLDEKSTIKDVVHFKKALLETDDLFVTGRLSINGKIVHSFPKKEQKLLVWKEVHSLYLADAFLRSDRAKVIGLIRSPLAVLASWRNAPKEFDEQWDFSKEWRRAPAKNMDNKGYCFGYEAWKANCRTFLKLAATKPGNFCLASYEELLANPQEYTESLFSFAGLQFTDQTKQYLQHSRSSTDKNPYATNKTFTKDDRWKKTLPVEIIQEVQNDPFYQQIQPIFGWEE